MAVLTLTSLTPYTIQYVISDLTEEWVNTARVKLFYYGQEQAVQTITYEAVDVAGATVITGQFYDLVPNTRYTVNETIFDRDEIQSSSQTSHITTLADTSVAYNKHSVIISSKNTYVEWGLIPTERPIVNPPQPKTSFVEIPGVSESIDYTEILTGQVQYGQRTGSWTFYFDPEWPGGRSAELNSLKRDGRLWVYVFNSLLNYVHGKKHFVILEDDPNHSYYGRLTVSNWNSNGKFSQVTINYNIDPPSRITENSE